MSNGQAVSGSGIIKKEIQYKQDDATRPHHAKPPDAKREKESQKKERLKQLERRG